MYKRPQKNFAVILLLILTLGGNVVFVEGSHSNVSALDESKTLITCSPLYINGNDNFASQATTEGWQGDGSEANPYIIENYDININGNKSDGIKISNTNVYFIIRSCKIYGCGNWYASIQLSNVTNGRIEKIDSYNNFYG
ncbi:MAG: hypothetical protein QME68_08025, partial [Elusimicrobiota bacterium]|nr:hypothetical protein [Elusimicrobiota bacterium]